MRLATAAKAGRSDSDSSDRRRRKQLPHKLDRSSSRTKILYVRLLIILIVYSAIAVHTGMHMTISRVGRNNKHFDNDIDHEHHDRPLEELVVAFDDTSDNRNSDTLFVMKRNDTVATTLRWQRWHRSGVSSSSSSNNNNETNNAITINDGGVIDWNDTIFLREGWDNDPIVIESHKLLVRKRVQ